jgi:hypothetical protein
MEGFSFDRIVLRIKQGVNEDRNSDLFKILATDIECLRRGQLKFFLSKYSDSSIIQVGGDFMKKAFLVSIVLFLLIGCSTAMTKHREQVRSGLLTVGLNREAFLKEWGMPDKTYVISGEEFIKLSASWGAYGGGAGFFKGKVPLDVWVYEKREITLVFNGIRLVGWKTEKTRKELESPQK